MTEGKSIARFLGETENEFLDAFLERRSFLETVETAAKAKPGSRRRVALLLAAIDAIPSDINAPQVARLKRLFKNEANLSLLAALTEAVLNSMRPAIMTEESRQQFWADISKPGSRSGR